MEVWYLSVVEIGFPHAHAPNARSVHYQYFGPNKVTLLQTCDITGRASRLPTPKSGGSRVFVPFPGVRGFLPHHSLNLGHEA
jgi:hypothetical protein